MHKPGPAVPALQSVGVVHRVDTVNRELTVLVNGDLLTFDVPVDCAIVLHGERVRFRMMQPRDRVRVWHARRGRFLVALAIEVQPEEAL
ncbi:MAG TPA: hypothetical protein VJ739_01305 [Gemmataceae bacterium]|nr:hypothetical protein [Gemmataceae bacterium]